MKRTDTICICKYCLQEMESRGVKIAFVDTHYDPDIPCEWCGEWDDELDEIVLK